MSRRTNVIELDAAPARSTPTSTGVVFLAGLVEKGLLDPQQPIRSYGQLLTRHGQPQSWSTVHVWAELFFRRGGNALYLKPVLGPAALQASANLTGTSGTTLIVKAKSAGEWGNGAAGGLTVEVVNGPAGGTTRVLIIRLNGVEVSRSPEFTTRDGFITWSLTDNYVDVTAGGGTNSLPVVAAGANLTGGTLDRTNITDTQVDAALAAFSKDLGPGQLVAPDWPTSTVHDLLKSRAALTNRFAVPDTPYGASKATLLTLGAVNLGDTNADRSTVPLAPWLTCTGNRVCPLSALFCGAAAVTDATEGPNQVPAGVNGRAITSMITGLSATFSETDQAELEAGGIGLAVLRNFEPRIDTNRTMVNPTSTDKRRLQIGNMRFRMALTAELESGLEPWEHLQITPENISTLGTAATGVMMRHQGSFYPGANDPGWIVDVGDAVNTQQTAEAGQFAVAVGYRPAKGADMTTIYLTQVGMSDAIG